MCWYSTDLSKDILQAEAGQRVGIRKVHGCSWVVRESDLHKQNPTPVCLIDETTVLFRFPELEQVTSNAAPEAKAVFRMLTRPKRDVFQFSDGREVGIDTLPSDLIFDILSVPGKGSSPCSKRTVQKLNPRKQRRNDGPRWKMCCNFSSGA
jgi:hypothetical protein